MAVQLNTMHVVATDPLLNEQNCDTRIHEFSVINDNEPCPTLCVRALLRRSKALRLDGIGMFRFDLFHVGFVSI